MKADVDNREPDLPALPEEAAQEQVVQEQAVQEQAVQDETGASDAASAQAPVEPEPEPEPEAKPARPRESILPILIPSVYAEAHARDSSEEAAPTPVEPSQPAEVEPAAATATATPPAAARPAATSKDTGAEDAPSSIAPTEIAGRPRTRAKPPARRSAAVPLALVAAVAIVGIALILDRAPKPTGAAADAMAPQAGSRASDARPTFASAATPTPTPTPAPQPLPAAQAADQLTAPEPEAQADEPEAQADEPEAQADEPEAEPEPAPDAVAQLDQADPEGADRRGEDDAERAGKRTRTKHSARKARRKQAAFVPAEVLPQEPSRNAVIAAMRRVQRDARRCTEGRHGVAELDVNVDSNGVVRHALISGEFAGTPEGSCIARAVRRARLPPFERASFRILYPLSL